MKNILVLIGLILITGCSTYSADRYSSSVDNVMAIRAEAGDIKVQVGDFNSAKERSEIICRGAGPVATADGVPFSEYIEKALIDELKMAGAFDPNAEVVIYGSLNEADFESMSGTWMLDLTVRSNLGVEYTVREDYDFRTAYVATDACRQSAEALMPAVQNLVAKVIAHEKFDDLIGAQEN